MFRRSKRLCLALGRRFARSESGAEAIEFALIAAVLIMLVAGALQLFIVMQAQAYLETAAEVAGRQVLTGQTQSGSTTQAQFKTAVCNAIPALLKCSGLMVDMQVATAFSSANTGAPVITYDASGKVTNNWSYVPGGPNDIVVLRLMYQWPVIPVLNFRLSNQSNGTFLLMATSVFKNEQYQ